MQTPWLSRVVGLLIAVVAVGAAVMLWLTVGADMPVDTPLPIEEWFLGSESVLYSPIRPPSRVFWASVAVAVLVTATVAAVELWWMRTSRRSLDPRTTPLSPRLVMERTRGRFDGQVTVTVLIPAHDEADALPVTIPALLAQSRPPDRVIVVADNCSDDTVGIARGFGVDVFETIGNTKKKAGALNQALRALLPDMGHNDCVMVMDADTSLDDGFLTAAVDAFTRDRALMAVGGLFYGEPGHGLIGQFQRNEYARYQRTIDRRRGKVFVLTGTSSVFRAEALRTVAAERGRSIPGAPGDVYDTYSLTEDNELTIALVSLGALMVSPRQCTVVTELMPTWRYLWRQRLRWQRGAVENIGQYGLTPSTFRYWSQQVGIGYGTIALAAYLLMMFLLLVSFDTWVWFPFWLAVGLVFVAERVVTVWHGGPRARWLAAALFPELLYDMFLDVVYVVGIVNMTFNRQADWGHVDHGNRTAAAPARDRVGKREDGTMAGAGR